MDGNFSAEHMKARTREADIPLSAGMAFMVSPNSYEAHLHSGKEINQVCGACMSCNLSSPFHSPAHAIHTRPLSRQIPEGHTLMLQALGLQPAPMDSLSLHL